jgi:hypothetical protein
MKPGGRGLQSCFVSAYIVAFCVACAGLEAWFCSSFGPFTGSYSLLLAGRVQHALPPVVRTAK